MKKNNFSCPVPLEQQPLYEYENLKNAFLFSWTTQHSTLYVKNIIILFTASLLSSAIFVKMVMGTPTDLMTQLVFTNLIASSLSILFLFRIYLGWKYVYIRLKEAIISYEESGWYDGQFWIKSSEALLKDTIIADYLISPILKKIKITIGILFVCFILSLLSIQ